MKRYARFMWMRTPQEALDVIADLIRDQAPLKEQDAWLKACVELELVHDGGNEKRLNSTTINGICCR